MEHFGCLAPEMFRRGGWTLEGRPWVVAELRGAPVGRGAPGRAFGTKARTFYSVTKT